MSTTPAPTATAPANTDTTLATSSVDSAGFGMSTASQFAHVQRVATMLSQSQLIPVSFQKNIPNCVIALEMAERIGCGVMAVMQNLNVIHGRPSFSSTFCIASVNSSGRFTPITFKYEGKVGAMDRSCRAVSRLKATGEVCEGAIVSMQMAQEEGWLGKAGSKWKTMPELMLSYRAATFFTRMYAPEMLLGMKTEDEVIDIQPSGEPTIEKIAQPALTNSVDGIQPAGTCESAVNATRRGRGGVNAMKRASAAPEVVVPPETEKPKDEIKPAEPVTTPPPAVEPPPAAAPAAQESTTTEPSFSLTEEPAAAAAVQETAAPVVPPAPPTKRCEVVSITPRKSTAGPVLSVILKGDFDGTAYFMGTSEKFPAGVGSVADFEMEERETGVTKLMFILKATVLA